MPGPRRLPTKVKLARGTYEPTKQGPAELEPEPDGLRKLPPAPRHLGAAGKKCWREDGARLLKMRMLTAHDLKTLLLWCECWDEKARLDKILDREPWFEEGSRHPALIQRDTLLKRLDKFLQYWGMHPSARASIRIPKEKPAALKARSRA